MPKNKMASQNANKKESVVQSIHRAADILKCISNGVNSITEIANKCKLSKSTVHRILKALEESELVMQDPMNHQYFLGFFVIKLISAPATVQEFLISSAGEEMEYLSEITGETVSLGIKMGLKNIGLHSVPSKSELKVISDNRKFRPVHAGVDGRVLLSQLDDNELSITVEEMLMEPSASPDSVNTKELLTQINVIRQQGYAISYNEGTLGVVSLSAPIKNYVLPAVLSLIGPEFRMKPKIKDLITELTRSSNRISNNLTKWPALKPYVSPRRM